MLYKRNIQEKINKWLLEEEIIVLNGPRQVGKTSLLKLLQNELMLQQIREEQIFYLNLEKLEVLDDLNKSPENLLNYIKIKGKKAYFLLDEIQYLDNPSNFLKHIYDEYRDKVKLIVTGSSSLELKAKLQDSLVGRKISFMVKPLCFEEFLRFKKSDVLEYYHKGDIPLEIKNRMKKSKWRILTCDAIEQKSFYPIKTDLKDFFSIEDDKTISENLIEFNLKFDELKENNISYYNKTEWGELKYYLSFFLDLENDRKFNLPQDLIKKNIIRSLSMFYKIILEAQISALVLDDADYADEDTLEFIKYFSGFVEFDSFVIIFVSFYISNISGSP